MGASHTKLVLVGCDSGLKPYLVSSFDILIIRN